jgi:hypothetical protein
MMLFRFAIARGRFVCLHKVARTGLSVFRLHSTDEGVTPGLGERPDEWTERSLYYLLKHRFKPVPVLSDEAIKRDLTWLSKVGDPICLRRATRFGDAMEAALVRRVWPEAHTLLSLKELAEFFKCFDGSGHFHELRVRPEMFFVYPEPYDAAKDFEERVTVVCEPLLARWKQLLDACPTVVDAVGLVRQAARYPALSEVPPEGATVETVIAEVQRGMEIAKHTVSSDALAGLQAKVKPLLKALEELRPIGYTMQWTDL